ncbi:MAG: hypothetical protein EAZ16_12545 [Sphingobacteriales bacterium]|jgi:hypothetical protein|nr:MAG: hypothetical protein EAZ16_12545 [Sphingobacteriales bacterium]
MLSGHTCTISEQDRKSGRFLKKKIVFRTFLLVALYSAAEVCDATVAEIWYTAGYKKIKMDN